MSLLYALTKQRAIQLNFTQWRFVQKNVKIYSDNNWQKENFNKKCSLDLLTKVSMKTDV